MPSPKTATGAAPVKTHWRKKKIKTPPGHPTDADLIAQYLRNGGPITQCAPGVALGSMLSSDQGLVAR